MRRAMILAAVLSLGPLAVAGCATTDETPPAGVLLDPCPPSASAALEPRPGEVALSEDEQLGLDVAGIQVLGVDRYADRELSEAQQDARTGRLENRIQQTRTWCQTRSPPDG